MRKIKYIASMVFVTVMLILIGDMYVWNMDSFETEYISTTMYLPAGTSQDTMISDLKKAAKKNNCLIFTVNRKIENVHSEIVSVYCMDGAEDILREKSSIFPGNYYSIFLGDVQVTIESLENIPDVNSVEAYYLIGNIENARKFKSELVDIYSGNIPKEGYVYFNAERTVACVWGVSVGFFLLLTLFETILLKKEITVRFIYGESVSNIIFKRILTDCLFYIGYFGLNIVILKRIFNIYVDYLIYFSVLCLVIFCMINSLLYIRLFFIDYKSSLSRGKGNKTVLNVSYLYKTVTVVIITCVMSMCIEMIVKGVEYWHQESFFKQRNDWDYISISSDDGGIDTTNNLMLSYLKEKSDAGKTFLNMYLDDGIFSGKPCLLFNEGALDYLTSEITDIQEFDFEDKIYFIVPERNSEEAASDLEFLAEMYIGEGINYQVITYCSNTSIIGIVNEGSIDSKLFDNPLVILNMCNTTDYYNPIYITQACMFHIDEQEWAEYMAKNDICENTSFITNVYENYSYCLKTYQRLLILGVVVFVILFVMEFIIIRTILQYECTINATELAVKTVLGYSTFEKYRKMFLTTALSLAISAAASGIITVLFGSASLLYLVFGYLMFGGTEVIAMLHYIRIMESTNIQKILKGGMF